ncbi:putative acid-CoA ligase [Cupriavidus necator]|uniref:Putative acid-CoA ligase n=1 Tax=Cupriavidus necator TaxID=106590 RepID=A0A1K0JM03_CUPNE|nr:putative acid-CoA ligase [Cupriavidus necator]
MGKDVSGWSTRLTAEIVARYTASGHWTGITLGHCAQERARTAPERIAVVDGSTVLSFGQLFEQGVRLAMALRRRGLKPGEVVSFQLPNWHEAMVINLAAAIGGFVCNPIVPIYRDAEVSFILKNSHTRVLFMPDAFRSIDYVEMVERLRPGLPDLRDVVLVRAPRPGYTAFADWLADDCAEPFAAAASFAGADANAVKLLLYTSGTTGAPKGVLHSHNTLRAEIDAAIRLRSLGPDDVVFMPSPVTHITGYLYALELPFAAGMKVVLMDRWNVAEGVDLMARHRATFSVGATPFLLELVAEVERRGLTLPSLRQYGCGGAPVPPEAIERARTVLPNCATFRGYGCSEAPTVSSGVAQGDPVELGATTDGRIYNHEVRIVDAVTGEPLAAGQPGEIVTRGPEVMLGYTKPADNDDAFDEEGFFHTGDLGVVDARGYLTVTGRKKDLIIRGGENISPKEIEDVLHQHPAVGEAAVVAMPHARMGETPCAYVVVRAGASLDFEAKVAFLETANLARQKIPEQLVLLDELPHNAAGKVLKHVLRARAAGDAARAARNA